MDRWNRCTLWVIFYILYIFWTLAMVLDKVSIDARPCWIQYHYTHLDGDVLWETWRPTASKCNNCGHFTTEIVYSEDIFLQNFLCRASNTFFWWFPKNGLKLYLKNGRVCSEKGPFQVTYWVILSLSLENCLDGII